MPGDSTEPVTARSSRRMILRSATHLLAEEDEPGDAGHRPGDVDDQSGRSASSEVRFQAKRVNSMPA